MRSRNRVQRISRRRVKVSKKSNRKKSIKKLRRSKRNKRKGGANNDSEIQEEVEEQINKIVSAFENFEPQNPGEEGNKEDMTFTSLFDLVFGENNYIFSPNTKYKYDELIIRKIELVKYDSGCDKGNTGDCNVTLKGFSYITRDLDNIKIKFEKGSPVDISKKKSETESTTIVKKKVSGGGNATTGDINYANEKLNSLFNDTKNKITSLQNWDRGREPPPPILVKSNENKFLINPVYLNAADNDLQNKLKDLLSISIKLGLKPIIPEKYKQLI